MPIPENRISKPGPAINRASSLTSAHCSVSKNKQQATRRKPHAGEMGANKEVTMELAFEANLAMSPQTSLDSANRKKPIPQRPTTMSRRCDVRNETRSQLETSRHRHFHRPPIPPV